MMNTGPMPADEQVSHALLVLAQPLEAPAGRIDGRHDVDVDRARPRIEAETRIDVPRDLEVERDDRRLQAGRQVKGALVEGTNLPRRDASPLRTQIDRFAGPSQDAIRALEPPDPLDVPCLRHREKRAHQ